MGMLEWHTYGLRQERIGHGDQDVGRGAEVTGVEGPGALVARTGGEGAEVEGVDLDEVQYPRVWARRGDALDGQSLAEGGFILGREPPHYELVVPSMPFNQSVTRLIH